MCLLRNDLWSEVICFEVLFRSYFFHHVFNKYLTRAQSELGILLCSGDIWIQTVPCLQGADWGGERTTDTSVKLMKHESQTVINSYTGEGQDTLRFYTGHDLSWAGMGWQLERTPFRRTRGSRRVCSSRGSFVGTSSQGGIPFPCHRLVWATPVWFLTQRWRLSWISFK